MCTLEVLLIADVMRRTTRDFDANNNDNGVRRGARSVCRKLFACEAPAADRSRLLRRMEEQIRKQDSERWNFDFEKETPLPGRYQWVKVSAAPAVSTSASTHTVVSPVVEECVPSESATTSKISHVSQRKSSSRGEQPKITETDVSHHHQTEEFVIQPSFLETHFMNQKKRHRTTINASSSPKQKVRRTSSDSLSRTTTT